MKSVTFLPYTYNLKKKKNFFFWGSQIFFGEGDVSPSQALCRSQLPSLGISILTSLFLSVSLLSVDSFAMAPSLHARLLFVFISVIIKLLHTPESTG